MRKCVTFAEGEVRLPNSGGDVIWGTVRGAAHTGNQACRALETERQDLSPRSRIILDFILFSLFLPIFSLGVDQRTVKTFRRVEHDGSRLFPPFPPVGRADVDLERLPTWESAAFLLRL